MSNTSRRSLTVLALTAALATPARADDAPTITVESLLRKMVDLSWLAQPPAAGERSVMFSSYDRASRIEGDAFVNPFANNDRGHYLRVEGEGDRREWVLAEAKGPGYVSRIWSANPDGELRIYIDGAEKPTIAAPFATVASSPLGGPFPKPFAHVAARGHNLYFPIPFAKSIKITTTRGEQYYQVNVTTLPEGTRVQSYSPDRKIETAVNIAHAMWPSPGDSTAAAMAAEPFTLKPGESKEIVPAQSVDGRPGLITGLACTAATTGRDDGTLGEVLARTLLTITFDGAASPQVAAPLGDFFGAGPGAAGCHTVVTSSGTNHVGGTFFLASSRWIMPYRRSARIVLTNQSTHEARFQFHESGRQDPAAAGMLEFHARWKSAEDLQTKKFDGTLDWPALRVSGAPGRFVGLMLNVHNPTTAWWGEGDEKIYVDGEKFPSTFGTGTEDYFGYAWGSSELFDGLFFPFHAQPRADGPGSMGNVVNIRHQILDSVPFHKSLAFDMEIWHWEAAKIQYETLALFYAGAGATIEPGIPDLSRRTIHPKPPVKREPGAVEGEDLRVRNKTAGDAAVQDMLPFGDAWSGARQLFWIVRENGARIDLEVRVERDATYALWGGFTRAPDYGTVQAAIDGENLGRPIDLYAPGVVHSGAKALGIVSLDVGTHVLSLTVAGKNPASTSFLVGLDWLKLQPTTNVLPEPEELKPRR